MGEDQAEGTRLNLRLLTQSLFDRFEGLAGLVHKLDAFHKPDLLVSYINLLPAFDESLGAHRVQLYLRL